MKRKIVRRRTAIRRGQLSRPIRLALEDGVIDENTRVFDYGCGHGEDLQRLQTMGIDCWGWDPAFSPHATKVPADIVNLGYVINVIEDPEERLAHLLQFPAVFEPPDLKDPLLARVSGEGVCVLVRNLVPRVSY